MGVAGSLPRLEWSPTPPPSPLVMVQTICVLEIPSTVCVAFRVQSFSFPMHGVQQAERARELVP